MPKKHPNSIRWGGSGASHEDATSPIPERDPAHPDDAVSTNPRVSTRSGGGGERDEKHSHVDPMRSSKSHATDGASPSDLDRAFRENRSRRDRAADRQPDNDEGESDEEDAIEESEEQAAEGVDLPVMLNTDSSVRGDERLSAWVAQIVRAHLRHLAPQLTRVEAYVTDSKRGGRGSADLRCALEARPTGARPVGADHDAATIEEAVRGAAGKLARLLRSQLGRRRDVKGGATIREVD